MRANLEYYKVFYYVVKYGSLTEAAKSLSVSQPAVSQQLQKLEDIHGVKLIQRTPRGIKLTAEGEMLFEYVARGYEQIETGEKKLLQMLHMETGEIHIGASDMTLHFFLLDYLEKYHELYPDIRVVVNNAPTPETMALLRQGKIDFGVVSGPLPEADDIEALSVRRIRDIFIAGEKYYKLKKRQIGIEELKDFPLIFLEKGTSSTRRYMDDFLLRNGVEASPEFELATSDMIVQFVLRNLGVGCVVEDFAKEALASGQVFELMLDKKIPEREFYVIWSKSSPVPYAAEKLMEMIRKSALSK